MRSIPLALAAGLIVVAMPAVSAAESRQLAPKPIDHAALFRAAGKLYGFDPELLEAIALVESGMNPVAVSPKGAQGLMQLMPGTAARFGVSNPFDPVANTLGAVRFLASLREWSASRNGSRAGLAEILAAYNAGPGAVEKYGGIPPYAETQQYVRKVLINYLIDDQRSALAAKLRQAPPVAQRVVAPEKDPLMKLAEIRRMRAQALERQHKLLLVERAR
jgi:soluble lytic murein transglycosylase-like protein